MKQNFDKTDRFIVVVNMDWENKQVGTLDLSPGHLGLAHEGSLRLEVGEHGVQGTHAAVHLPPRTPRPAESRRARGSAACSLQTRPTPLPLPDQLATAALPKTSGIII